MQIGFKVVRKTGDVQGSFCPATSSALQTVRYRFLKETIQDKRMQGPFAVFRQLKHAEDFRLMIISRVHILLCEYEETNEDVLWHGLVRRSTLLEECPHGTVLAKLVVPLCLANDHDPDSLTLKNLKE